MPENKEPDPQREALAEQAKALYAHVRRLRLMAIVICLLLVFLGLVFGFMRVKHGAGDPPSPDNKGQEADKGSAIAP